jgi:MFS transporter, ACS family, hexuronate transporter
MLVDRVSVRWLYPAVLAAWSLMGFVTGMTTGFRSMLICRTLLGFFEAGHWPCALVVTHAVLNRSDRTMGNSILQSGASLGAIITPLIILVMVGESTAPGVWRPPFIVVGALGILWCVAWLRFVGPATIPRQQPASLAGSGDGSNRLEWLSVICRNKHFWALVIVVISINTSWQLIREWLLLILKDAGYSKRASLITISIYYLASDVGCILAGAAVLRMARRGTNAHSARVSVFAVCAALTCLTLVAANLPLGWAFLGILFIVAAGLLGLFPCYYSMTQDIDARHIGKLTGLLGFIGWMASSPMQTLFGMLADKTGSFDRGLAIVGCLPAIGLLALMWLWRPPWEPHIGREGDGDGNSP